METGTESATNRHVFKGGKFQPGQSGNPNGRPRKTPIERLTKQLSRQEAQQAVERLMSKALVAVEKALKSRDETIALRAALSVLDRGLGLPTQRIEGSLTTETVVTVTPAMLQAAARKLLAATAEDAREVDHAGAD